MPTDEEGSRVADRLAVGYEAMPRNLVRMAKGQLINRLSELLPWNWNKSEITFAA